MSSGEKGKKANNWEFCVMVLKAQSERKIAKIGYKISEGCDQTLKKKKIVCLLAVAGRMK